MIEEFPNFVLNELVIRGFENDDIDLVEKASKDPVIPRITSIPANFSIKSGMEYIERQKSRHKTGRGYSFAIADIKTNTAIGSIFVGLNNTDAGRASIGYWVLEEVRGNRVINRSLPAVIAWAFENLKIPRLELYIEPCNEGSIKTAESLGFRNEGLMRSWQAVGSERKDMFMFSLLTTD